MQTVSFIKLLVIGIATLHTSLQLCMDEKKIVVDPHTMALDDLYKLKKIKAEFPGLYTLLLCKQHSSQQVETALASLLSHPSEKLATEIPNWDMPYFLRPFDASTEGYKAVIPIKKVAKALQDNGGGCSVIGKLLQKDQERAQAERLEAKQREKRDREKLLEQLGISQR